MNEEQISQQLDDIEEATMAYTLTVEMIQATILELLKQKEELLRQKKLLKKPTKIWFSNKKE